MARRRTLLLATFGGKVSEVVTGLRSLPHDRLVLITGKGETDGDEHHQMLSLLDHLGVRYQVLTVDHVDLTGSAVLIEELIRGYKGRDWHIMVDITGGSKLLSDATVLAAVATGSEVCCFEGEARRIKLLDGMGIRELLPKAVAAALSDHTWPIPLQLVQEISRQNAGDRIFMRMKDLDLVSLQSIGGSSHLCLTDRGRACLEWSRRMNGSFNVSSG